jgi:hypothetical protein
MVARLLLMSGRNVEVVRSDKSRVLVERVADIESQGER